MFSGPWSSVKLTGRSEMARKWSMQARTRGMRPSRSGSGGTRRATCDGSVMAGPATAGSSPGGNSMGQPSAEGTTTVPYQGNRKGT